MNTSNQHGIDQTQIQNILQENIRTLCNNWLNYDQNFTVQGLLGITIDDKAIILVNVNENVVYEKQSPALELKSQKDTLRINGFSPLEEDASKDQNEQLSYYSQKLPKQAVKVKTNNSVSDTPNKNDSCNQMKPNCFSSVPPSVVSQGQSTRLDVRQAKTVHERGLNYSYESSSMNSSTVQNQDLNKNDKTYRSKQWPLISDILDNSECMDLSKKSQSCQNISEIGIKPQSLEPNRVKNIENKRLATSNKRKNIEQVGWGSASFAEPDHSVKKSKHENGLNFPAESTHKVWKSVSENTDFDNPVRREKDSKPSLSNNSPSHSVFPSYSQHNPYMQESDVEYPKVQVKSEYEPKKYVQKMTAPMMKTPKGKSPAGSHRRSHGELDKLAAQVAKLEYSETANSAQTTPPPNISLDTPTSSTQMYDLVLHILKTPGSFVSVRVVRRRCQKYNSGQIVQAMIHMTKASEHKHYIGEFKYVKSTVKVLYKCPPSKVGEEALQHFGISKEEYEMYYMQSAKPSSGAPSGWNLYLETILAMSPFADAMSELPDFQAISKLNSSVYTESGTLDESAMYLDPNVSDQNSPESQMNVSMEGNVQQEAIFACGVWKTSDGKV